MPGCHPQSSFIQVPAEKVASATQAYLEHHKHTLDSERDTLIQRELSRPRPLIHRILGRCALNRESVLKKLEASDPFKSLGMLELKFKVRTQAVRELHELAQIALLTGTESVWLSAELAPRIKPFFDDA